MIVQTFRDILPQRPFKPFRLVMSSGQTYEVHHPDMAVLTRTSMLVGVDIADDGVSAEFKICCGASPTANRCDGLHSLATFRRVAINDLLGQK
jgi:hypothetical protein